MENKVIKALNQKHGERVIKYFKSLGVDTHDAKGYWTEEDGDRRIYYGIIKNNFNCFSLEQVEENGCLIIEIPEKEEYKEEKSFPRVMSVSNDNVIWCKREVFAKKHDLYLAWECADLDAVENCTDIFPWKYAKEVDPPKVITADDIILNIEKVKISLGYDKNDEVILELNK